MRAATRERSTTMGLAPAELLIIVIILGIIGGLVFLLVRRRGR
jgi:hypothetical protein